MGNFQQFLAPEWPVALDFVKIYSLAVVVFVQRQGEREFFPADQALQFPDGRGARSLAKFAVEIAGAIIQPTIVDQAPGIQTRKQEEGPTPEQSRIFFRPRDHRFASR